MDGGGGAASRHVGPPRALDVQQFAAARASEVQVLYNALKAQQQKEEKSSLTTTRHLRRRTASHNRRLPFRWRNNSAAQAGKKEKEKKTIDKATVGSSSLPKDEIGPPTPAEESSRKRKPEKRIPSRRVRRRIELQGVRDGTTSCMRDGTRRLATHVWHAKRFPMMKTWGYSLPKGLPGRGRGSKAVFKWVKEAAVLHDASYIGVIELQGTQGAILKILCQILEPPPSGSRAKEEEMHGLLYGNAVLHNVGKAAFEAIAPVTILWRPSSSSGGVGTSELFTVGERAAEERQLWISVHPSAFDNVLLVLSTACEQQGLDNLQSRVKCHSRRGDLARFDIFGRKALQVLQKVLRPIPRKLAHLSSSTEAGPVSVHQDLNTDLTTNTSPDVSQPLSGRIFAKADCLPAAAVLALDVYDPRDTPKSFYSGTNTNMSGNAPDGMDDSNLRSDSPYSSNHPMVEEGAVQDRKPPVDAIEDTGGTEWENLVGNGLSKEVSDSPYLWSPQPERKFAALSQKAFSEKRHKRRKAYFSGVDKDFLHSSFQEGALNSRLRSGACPVLLLKHAHSSASASGWSIILPITWVQAFLVPLVFAGGHVIGLRERHWLATDAGLPYFPHDFPDCPAHAEHLAIESAAFNSTNEGRPPSKRSPCSPVSPLQRSIMCTYRDHILKCSGKTAPVASELVDEEHGEQSVEAKCTTPAGGIPRLADVNGDIAMTEAASLATREPSPPVSLFVSSEFTNVDGDTKQPATCDKVTSSSKSPEGCENVLGVNSPKPNAPLAEDLASLTESLPDTVPSLEVSTPGIDGEILSEFASPEGDTPGTMVSGSLVPTEACPIQDGVGIPELTVPLGYNPVKEGSSASQDTGPALPVHSVDGALNPEFANPDGDIQMPGFEALVKSSSESPAPCQAVDGTFIPELSRPNGDISVSVDGVTLEAALERDTAQTLEGVSMTDIAKPLRDTAADEVKSLPDTVLPLPLAFPDIDAAVVPEVIHLDEDSEMVATGAEVSRSPSSEIVDKRTAEPSLQQLTKPHDHDATVLDDVPQHGINSSSAAASQLEQPIFDAHETERFSLEVKAIAVEEMIVSRSIEFDHLEVPEVMGNVTDSRGRDKPSIPLRGSVGYHTSLGLNSDMKSTRESPTLPFFVARTLEALMKVFRENGLQSALLLCSSISNSRSVQHGLRKGTLEWRASHDRVETSACTGKSNIHAMVGGHGKGCYVRVLIKIPRKGVLKENGLLCCPTKEDFDAFLSRSLHWQGVETSWQNPQSKELKKRKGKRKEKGKRKRKEEAAKSPTHQSYIEAEDIANSTTTTTQLAVGYEECCSREAIGCITSTGLQGSSWLGTGICEVSSLMKLRAMQWQDQRWWNNREIFLLAGNSLSPILRPVMVSIVLETGSEQDITWL
ncbi:unnamed protein product [Calypogeia fissa]